MLKSLAALFLAAAAAAPAASVDLGPLALDHDPAVWRVTETGPAAWLAEPVERGEPLLIRADPSGGCSQEAMLAEVTARERYGDRKGSTVLGSGLTLHWAEADSGCRNLTPAILAACVVHGGRTIRFDTPRRHCDGDPSGPKPLALLQGLRRARPR